MNIWIDTDPGIDDALAFVMAVRSPEIQLIGFSTVHGNIDVAHGTANALKVLELLGSSVPVWAGAPTNMLGDLRTAPFIHGDDGLGDLLPATTRSVESEFGPLALVQTLMTASEQVVVMCLGPLTNIALALAIEPRIAARIERLVIMGGAMRCEGNTTPAAEFNTYCDPEAAVRVLNSGIAQTWVPLDVTMQTVMPARWSATLATSDEPLFRFIGELTLFYSQYYRNYYGIDGCALHDPLTVAAAVFPDLLQTKTAYVAVELGGSVSRGRTVADLWGIPQPHGTPNADIALGVDVERFLDLFRQRVLGGRV